MTTPTRIFDRTLGLLEEILGWDFDRVIVAHGEVQELPRPEETRDEREHGRQRKREVRAHADRKGSGGACHHATDDKREQGLHTDRLGWEENESPGESSR